MAPGEVHAVPLMVPGGLTRGGRVHVNEFLIFAFHFLDDRATAGMDQVGAGGILNALQKIDMIEAKENNGCRQKNTG